MPEEQTTAASISYAYQLLQDVLSLIISADVMKIQVQSIIRESATISNLQGGHYKCNPISRFKLVTDTLVRAFMSANK